MPSDILDPGDRKMRALGSARHLLSMAFFMDIYGTQLQKSFSPTGISALRDLHRYRIKNASQKMTMDKRNEVAYYAHVMINSGYYWRVKV